MHRACKSGSGLIVLNCLCCTVLQVDTILIHVLGGDCTIRFHFWFTRVDFFADCCACLWAGESHQAEVQLEVDSWQHLRNSF